MLIHTFSVVVGTAACDAHCPFCVSHTTGFHNLPLKGSEINWRNFDKAIGLAKLGGTTTVLFTGKGEPTLYPAELTEYLEHLVARNNPFPFVELQTNAIRIGQVALASAENREMGDGLSVLGRALAQWHDLGLNTIAISTVGIRSEFNQRVYLHHRDVPYPDLRTTVGFLRRIGYSIRLCVMMQQEMTDTLEEVLAVASWCRENDVAQLTVRPIRRPQRKSVSRLPVVQDSTPEERYIQEWGITEEQEQAVREGIDRVGTHILTLMHAEHQAKVYDLNGQNVCVGDCLTVAPRSSDIRTLIYYGDGKLMFDWAYDGARLL